MDGERPRLTEPFAALVALEGLLLGVDVPVVPEMILSLILESLTIGIELFISTRSLIEMLLVGRYASMTSANELLRSKALLF